MTTDTKQRIAEIEAALMNKEGYKFVRSSHVKMLLSELRKVQAKSEERRDALAWAQYKTYSGEQWNGIEGSISICIACGGNDIDGCDAVCTIAKALED